MIPKASIPLNIPTGVTNIPVTNLGNNVNSLTFSLARAVTTDITNWPNSATTVTVSLQVSYDGGNTYDGGGSFSSSGGIVASKTGSDLPLTVVKFTYPQTPDHVKGTITVANGPLVTVASILVN